MPNRSFWIGLHHNQASGFRFADDIDAECRHIGEGTVGGASEGDDVFVEDQFPEPGNEIMIDRDNRTRVRCEFFERASRLAHGHAARLQFATEQRQYAIHCGPALAVDMIDVRLHDHRPAAVVCQRVVAVREVNCADEADALSPRSPLWLHDHVWMPLRAGKTKFAGKTNGLQHGEFGGAQALVLLELSKLVDGQSSIDLSARGPIQLQRHQREYERRPPRLPSARHRMRVAVLADAYLDVRRPLTDESSGLSPSPATPVGRVCG